MSERASSTELLSDQLSPNRRSTIDQEVYKWVMQQQTRNKVVTPTALRQKALEIGQTYDPNFKASLNWYTNWKKRFDYQETPEAEALKHKKRSYTAAFKLYAVQRSLEMESVSQASLELNVSRRCLQRWKEELDVISTVAEQASNAVYRRPGQGRKVVDSGLDIKLIEWLEGCWKDGSNVTSATVRQKAREFSANADFKASLGWYVKWQKRHNIDLKERTLDSPLRSTSENTPLKLRLLPEGQMAAYSDRPQQSRKRKRDYDADVPQESEIEFDRLLLTWLVERWEAGEQVTDKMLRDKAGEISTLPDFRPTKSWVLAWKEKYNVSLENQTYGTAGETEGEIVEESQVYDEVTIQEESPLTPTKEEAATALASLSSEQTSMSATEIAEALQKLALAFGQLQNPKDAFAHLAGIQKQTTPTPNATSTAEAITSSDSIIADAATYLLEGGVVSVGAEEVISEEIVTDEPVVVLEGRAGSHLDSKEPPVTTNLASDVEGLTSIVTVTTETTLSAPTVPMSSQESLSPNQAAIASGATVPSAVLQTEVTTSTSPYRPVLPRTVIARPLRSSAEHLAPSTSTDICILTPSSMAQLIAETLQGEMVAVAAAHTSPTSPVLIEEHLAQITPKMSCSVSEGLVMGEMTEPVTSSVEAAATLPVATVVTEEVVISEPIIETIVGSHDETVDDGQVMVIMEEGPALSIPHPTSLTAPLEEEFSMEWNGVSMIATSDGAVSQEQGKQEESEMQQDC